MAFDYSELAGKIKAKFKTQGAFARAMELSDRSVSLKLSNQIGWKQLEILRACKILGISEEEITFYFFTEKVQRNEQN